MRWDPAGGGKVTGPALRDPPSQLLLGHPWSRTRAPVHQGVDPGVLPLYFQKARAFSSAQALTFFTPLPWSLRAQSLASLLPRLILGISQCLGLVCSRYSKAPLNESIHEYTGASSLMRYTETTNSALCPWGWGRRLSFPLAPSQPGQFCPLWPLFRRHLETSRDIFGCHN